MKGVDGFPIGEYPRFYYSGRRGMKGDQEFIFKRLSRLSPRYRRIVSEEYERIYLTHWNEKEYRKAREEANKYLAECAETSGITKKELDEAREEATALNLTRKATKEWIEERIARIKAAKPTPKTILGMAEKERAYR